MKLWLFDLSNGLARQMSLPLIGRQIEGIWHTSIVVYGKEYFYGSDGIHNCLPGQTIVGGNPYKEFNMGETSIPKDVFDDFLAELG